MNAPTSRTTRRALATVATAAVLAGTGAALVPDAAHAATATRTTVSASDTSVSSGEQLRLSGTLSKPGTVTVQSRSGSTWTTLSGAVVHTRRDGGYSVRVVLGRTGSRELRVLGNPDAAGFANSTARVTVRVS